MMEPIVKEVQLGYTQMFILQTNCWSILFWISNRPLP